VVVFKNLYIPTLFFILMAEMYDKPKHVEDTFNEENLSEYLIHAQKVEFIELKKVVSELYKKKKSPLTILDIGMGDGRMLKLLSQNKEMWSAIEHYDGIDVAQNCIDISIKVVSELKINKKVTVKLLDAVDLKTIKKKYDLIISTWFTAGNFYPFDFDFKKCTERHTHTETDTYTKNQIHSQ